MAQSTDAQREAARVRQSRLRARLKAEGVHTGRTSCPVYPKNCDRCGEAFVTRMSNGVFCSEKCRYAVRDARPEIKARKNARQRAAYRPTGNSPGAPRTQPDECIVEGCSRQPLALSKCQRHYRAQRRAEGVPWACEGSKAYKARAERHGVAYEPVNRIRVFERDGWICGICNLPVQREDASLDHITPMAHGGEHSYRNTQCSHLICNILKRDSITAPPPGGGASTSLQRSAPAFRRQ